MMCAVTNKLLNFSTAIQMILAKSQTSVNLVIHSPPQPLSCILKENTTTIICINDIFCVMFVTTENTVY